MVITSVLECDGNYSPAGFVRNYDFPVAESAVKELTRMDYVEWVRLRNWPDTDSTRFKLTEYRQSVLVLHIKGP